MTEKIYYRIKFEVYLDEEPDDMTNREVITAGGFVSRDAPEEFYIEDLPYNVQKYFTEETQ